MCLRTTGAGGSHTNKGSTSEFLVRGVLLNSWCAKVVDRLVELCGGCEFWEHLSHLVARPYYLSCLLAVSGILGLLFEMAEAAGPIKEAPSACLSDGRRIFKAPYFENMVE